MPPSNSSSSSSARPGGTPARAASYKSRQLFRSEDLRRRREEQQVEIRRQARSEHNAKRRNLDVAAGALTDGDTTEDEDAVDAALELDQGVGSLHAIVEELRYGGPEKQIASVIKLRKLLSKEVEPPTDAIIQAGAVPLLAERLQSPSELLQFEAAWALTNIASGTSEHTDIVVMSGAVPHFIDMLAASESDEVREQAIWALGNIAGDKTHNRDIVLHHGIMPPLLELFSRELKIGLLRNAVWTLSNLCRGKNPSPPWEAVAPAIPVLSKLLYVEDDETVADAVWTLSYLSDGDNTQITAVLESGPCPRLVELLGHSNRAVVTPTLRAVGNIVTGEDTQTDVAIAAGCIPAFGRLLHSGVELIRKEACWAISNIAAGTPMQVQALVDANIFPPLINLMTSAEARTRKEACWAVSNATKIGLLRPELIRYLVSQGCIGPLCSMLDLKENQTIQVALDALFHILRVGEDDKNERGPGSPNVYAGYVEECGGLIKIHQLQHHQNNAIYKACFTLIDTFFPDDEIDEMAESAPDPAIEQTAAFVFQSDLSAPSGGFTFGVPASGGTMMNE
ncbi:hypothetical protein A4X13_0g928 [Tilletia indica]|uniref:Importin subunit alpha n=1 Tax=Tilletia indica TaxID=43049 RepID=A0A177TGR5_9BASI|nr:hypothetical protein A4X13_0g928 [Tilletia indica]